MQPQLIAGRYQVLRAFGRGGMGTVWLCRDEVLGREVAVKQIGALPGESATETKRAMREARSAAALNHPNAVAVYDVVDHGGRPWLVMEYVEGQTLADEIAAAGQLSPQRVADIGSQLAGALARAHERGIVHRDIKPGNVLIDKAGRPKISDFGIARGHGDEKLTQIGFITGTPGYLSPELARGADPHPASDVWALGATLYSAVEGQPPYEPRSNPIALLRAIATERPRPMTHAGALGPAIDAMMDADPARRWDMATSARRLGGIARITMVIATPPPDMTQVLEPTQAFAPLSREVVVVAPVVAAPVVVAPAAAAGVAPVAPVPVPPAAPVVVAPFVPSASVAPVAVAPASQAVVAAAAPAAETQVAQPPVGATRVAEAHVAKPATTGRPEPQGPRELHADPPTPPAEHPARGRRWMPFVLVALLLAVLGMAYQLNQTADPGGATAGTTTLPSASQPRSTSTAPAQTTEAPPATTAPSTATSTSGLDDGKKLQEFVKSYYSDVTSKRDVTWAQLTPKMQALAGGRSGYDGFWVTIRHVKVDKTLPNASANQATVTLTYTRVDGSRVTETHGFTFVNQGGHFLINSD